MTDDCSLNICKTEIHSGLTLSCGGKIIEAEKEELPVLLTQALKKR